MRSWRQHVHRATSPSISLYDVSLTKNVFAHMVPQTGFVENNVACDLVLGGDFAWLGHTRITLRSDNGPGVRAFVDRVVEPAKSECTDFEQLGTEQSAGHGSQPNGGIEIGVRFVRALLADSEALHRREE